MKQVAALAVILTVATGTLFLLVGDRLDLWTGVRSWVFSETESTAETIVLSRIREVSQLSTLSYVERTVFPQDYFLDQSPYSLIERIRTAERPAEEVLSPEQLRYLEAFNLAVDVGLLPYWDANEFVVVTTVVNLGYDLAGDDETALPVESMIQTTEEAVKIYLPPPQVLSVTVEDITKQDYPYPPVLLQPEEWSRVVGFVSDQVRASVSAGPLMARARANGEQFFRNLLDRREVSAVEFVDAPLD